MKNRELLKLFREALNYYIQTLEECKEADFKTTDKLLNYLEKKYLYNGVCLLLSRLLTDKYKKIKEEDYKLIIYKIDNFKVKNMSNCYWFITPIDCHTINGIYVTMEYRIKMLKIIVEDLEKNQNIFFKIFDSIWK